MLIYIVLPYDGFKSICMIIFHLYVFVCLKKGMIHCMFTYNYIYFLNLVNKLTFTFQDSVAGAWTEGLRPSVAICDYSVCGPSGTTRGQRWCP